MDAVRRGWHAGTPIPQCPAPWASPFPPHPVFRFLFPPSHIGSTQCPIAWRAWGGAGRLVARKTGSGGNKARKGAAHRARLAPLAPQARNKCPSPAACQRPEIASPKTGALLVLTRRFRALPSSRPPEAHRVAWPISRQRGFLAGPRR